MLTENIVSTRLIPKIKGRRFDIQSGVKLNRKENFQIGVVDDWNSHVWGDNDENKHVIIYKNLTKNKKITIGSKIKYVFFENRNLEINSVKEFLQLLKWLKNRGILDAKVIFQPNGMYNTHTSIMKIKDFGI